MSFIGEKLRSARARLALGRGGPRQRSARRGQSQALLTRSAQAILLERLLRLAAALGALVLFFLTLSWLDFWRAAPVLVRMFGVGLFAFVGFYLTAREIARGWPKRATALKRLDAGAPPGLRPAQSLDDTLAQEGLPETANSETRALWAAHRRRLEAALARLPVAPPAPDLPARDPYALRALALVAAAGAAFVAGDEKSARVAAAFDWRAADLFAPSERIDAWFEPPAYTGRPAIVLGAEGGSVTAPENSILRVRPETSRLAVAGGLKPVETTEQAKASPVYRLADVARLDLPDGRGFDVAVIPDAPPTIALTEPPRNNARGSMTLIYSAQDDYGVTGVEAVFERPPGLRRSLYQPPKLTLPPPANPNETRATLDLAENPYAGAQATLRLTAADAAGHTASSPPREITLPARNFRKPLARALIEQRRNLALDPEARATVRSALEALALSPEIFDTPSGVHLGLRAARVSLNGPRTDDELRGIVDLLWAMALTVEDDAAGKAERDLRAAEQALRESLARGDSEEAIGKRSAELRAALDNLLSQLGAQPDPTHPREAENGDGSGVTPEELQSMMDDIEKATKAGDLAQARQLLDELQDIMENLRTGENDSPGERAARQRAQQAMQKSMRELDALAREEQQLRDQTYRGMNGSESDDGDPTPSQHGKGGDNQRGRDSASAERERQRELRERLERQQRDLAEQDPEAAGELDSARRAMKEAEEALGASGAGRGSALEAEGRAVESLRNGADRLSEKMQGEAEGGQPGEGPSKSRARGGKGVDPLGRTDGGRRNARQRYDPLGLPPAQRAHRVQEELRRRLGQPERPPEELDYLQRLLPR
jgi:uncharacterized protein (TIGR02302 family)